MQPLRRTVSRVARRVRAGRDVATLVVLLDGEPSAARRVLDSAVAQTVVPVEIVVVPLTDRLVGAAAQRALADSRVRVVQALGADRLEGRRRALAEARADAVVVLVPESPILPGAVAALVRRRAETGAAVVLGGQPGSGDLASCPGAARTPLLARLLVDRDLLRAQAPEADDPDGTVTALGLLRAGFAGVAAPTVRDVRPGDERALFRVSPWPAADARLGALAAGDTVLADLPEAGAARVRGFCERDGAILAEAGEDADDAGWARFVAMLAERVDDAVLRDLAVEPRVLLALARSGDRVGMVEHVAARRTTDGALPTTVVDGRVRAVLPGLAGLAADLLDLPDHQLVLRSRLHRLRRLGDEVELVVQAGIGYLDTRPGSVRAGITLVDGERTLAAAVTPGVDPDVTRWLAQRGQDHDGGSFTARVPVADLGDGSWQVRIDLTSSGVRREGGVAEIDPRGSATRARLVDGAVEVSAPWPVEGVADVVVQPDGSLVVSGGSALVGDVTLPADEDGRIRLTASTWGFPERPAPSGGYRLREGGEVVRPSGALLDRLPEEHVAGQHRILLRRGNDGGVVVRLGPPLDDAELGPRAQARLQAAYAAVRTPVDPGLVYVQCFTGQSPTDQSGAIGRELLRRVRERPDVQVRWLVADGSVGVPEGAEAVQHRSREWYDVLARAGYLVSNVDLDQWFVRREGQEVLQTYHGYPSKRVGLAQWRARGWSPSRIAQELARTSGTWTALLMPQPDTEQLFREAYAWDGRIISVGHPRDDDLIGPGHEARREAARERLGVGERKVLLYAPTWRDDLATDFRAAILEHTLDLPRLTEAIGEEWLVLMRGHRFHAPTGGGGRVLDVTSYPEINDLVLAADAAVLDYSSLRFHVALTGIPSIYLVPDLARYTGELRGFFQDYRDTAPGPLVESTADVVRELADWPGLVDRWREPIAAFNARYNATQDGHAAERVVDAFFAPLLSP